MTRPYENAVFDFGGRAKGAANLIDLNLYFRPVIESLGFRWWATTWLRGDPERRRSPRQRIFGEPSSLWWDRYSTQGYIEDDPVVREILRSDVPVIEKEVRNRGLQSARVRQICGEVIEFGVGHGLACPVRLANGDSWSMGFLGQEVDDDPALLSAVALLANIYTARAVGLSAADLPQFVHRLTPRMREIIAMLRHGETQCSVALDLGISTRTIEHLMHDARERLGVRTTPELIAEAMRSGEIGEGL